jgi:hypothetical protein
MKVRAYYQTVAPDWLKNYVRPQKRRAIEGYVWLRAQHPRERLKPAFLIVGVGKAGTTSLFEYLTSHPQIAEPLRKEIEYFSTHWHRPQAWYFAHFPRLDRVSPGVITGEASPGYVYDPEIPERIASVLPQAKIIVLLRNPILRAISHYYHDVNKKVVKRPRSLLESLAVEGMELQPELTKRLIGEVQDRRPIDAPLDGGRLPFYYVRLGLYANFLPNWLRCFGRDRVLILKSEDMFVNPSEAYAQTLKFLGLDFFHLGSMEPHNAGNYSKVDPIVLRYLSEIYADPNRRLYELLGVNLGWEDPSQSIMTSS